MAVMVAVIAIGGVFLIGKQVADRQALLAENAAEAESFIPAPIATASTDDRPVALFIGDSYTAGTGASSEAKKWASLVSAGMGWSEVNRGNGGTGYVSTAGMDGCGREACPAYQGVLSDVSEMTAEFVLISGGQNDLDDYQEQPEVTRSAVQETFAAYREAFPDATLVAVGPSTTGDPTEPTVNALDEAVQAAADAVGARYISLLDPPVIEPGMIDDDGAHVTDAGHAAIAERVLSALQ